MEQVQSGQGERGVMMMMAAAAMRDRAITLHLHYIS